MLSLLVHVHVVPSIRLGFMSNVGYKKQIAWYQGRAEALHEEANLLKSHLPDFHDLRGGVDCAASSEPTSK